MNEFRIVVVAPTGRDGPLICQLLERNNLDAVQCGDCEAAIGHAETGIGAFLLADEVLNAGNVALLAKVIDAQPSWSDLPVVVLTGGGQATPMSEARNRLREPLGNVIPIERPVRPETLVSTVNSALRARSRQYEVRDYLRQ